MNTLLAPCTPGVDESLIARLLAPLPFGSACGVPLRFDPVFTEIRLLREEDDPCLPMGQWERPLKLADWPRIEARCIELLCTRSKHLQLAAWLVEAWTREQGFRGLCQGLCLLDGLLRRYWDEVHPLIEDDGDAELRLAPLEWLNDALGLAAYVHAPLLRMAGMKPPVLTLALWERMTALEPAASAPGADVAEAPTRAEVQECALGSGETVQGTSAVIRQSLAFLEAIDATLEQQLADAAPKLGRLAARLSAAARAMTQLQPEYASVAVAAPRPDETDVASPADAPASPPPTEFAFSGRAWNSRKEAYATLEALAEYLAEAEPHSPVPFLIRRAVHWGRLPLPELIADMLREDGDLNRVAGFLGIHR